MTTTLTTVEPLTQSNEPTPSTRAERFNLLCEQLSELLNEQPHKHLDRALFAQQARAFTHGSEFEFHTLTPVQQNALYAAYSSAYFDKQQNALLTEPGAFVLVPSAVCYYVERWPLAALANDHEENLTSNINEAKIFGSSAEALEAAATEPLSHLQWDVMSVEHCAQMLLDSKPLFTVIEARVSSDGELFTVVLADAKGETYMAALNDSGTPWAAETPWAAGTIGRFKVLHWESLNFTDEQRMEFERLAEKAYQEAKGG